MGHYIGLGGLLACLSSVIHNSEVMYLSHRKIFPTKVDVTLKILPQKLALASVIKVLKIQPASHAICSIKMKLFIKI